MINMSNQASDDKIYAFSTTPRIVLASASPRRRELLSQLGLTFEVRPAVGDEVITKDDPAEVVMELAAQKAREVAEALINKSKGASELRTANERQFVREGVVGERWQKCNDAAYEKQQKCSGMVDEKCLVRDDARMLHAADDKRPGFSSDTMMRREDAIIVIGADTVVSCPDPAQAGRERILGKPKDKDDAFAMLSMLSGRTHAVYTGVAAFGVSEHGLSEASNNDGIESSYADETFVSGMPLIFYEKTLVTVRLMDEDEIRRYIATGEPMDKAGAYGIQGKFAAYIDKIDGDYNNVVGLPLAALCMELKRIGIDIMAWV